MAIPGLGMLLGKVAGKVAGGAAGGAEGGLNLPNAGQLGQLGFSVGQSIMGAVKNKQADAMTPPSENPMERQMLNTIRRRRRAIETGTANAAQNASVRQLGKTMMTNAARAGGQVNYGQYNQLIGNAMGNIANQTAQQINPLLGMEQQQATNMVNRATDLSLLRRNEEKANAARLRQAGSQNLLATMGAGKLDKENQGLRSQSNNQNTQIDSLMAIIKELQGKIAAQPAATTGS
jgi:hypothetical protein